MELSPNFSANQTIYAVGSNVYRSRDAGESWQTASAPPPIIANSEPSWQPRRLTVAVDDALFLAIYSYEMAPPYRRHDQLWTSSDGGDTWSQLSAAPDRPVADLTVSQTDDALYLSTFDDNPIDEFDIAPDLFRSGDRGATWQNLGAIPNGATGSKLLAPPGLSDTLLVGGSGVWQISPSSAPTATPNPCRELLLNRSFEYDGLWRIPTTGYSALRSMDRHSHGYWSMRTGIVDVADNRRSYSDFSQDVALPDLPALSLRIDRWPQAGAGAQAASTEQPDAILAATTLDEFRAALEASAADLQYAMVITPPAGTIHFLYTRLDDDQAWVSEEFDLAEYRGQTVRLQFGTFNNGVGPLAAQFFDNMRLQVCSEFPPTPTPSATPLSQTWLPVILRSGGGGTIPPPIGE